MTAIDPRAYQILALRVAIKLYANTGIKANSAYTPSAMLATASKLADVKFKRGQFQEAYDALSALIAMPTVKLESRH